MRIQLRCRNQYPNSQYYFGNVNKFANGKVKFIFCQPVDAFIWLEINLWECNRISFICIFVHEKNLEDRNFRFLHFHVHTACTHTTMDSTAFVLTHTWAIRIWVSKLSIYQVNKQMTPRIEEHYIKHYLRAYDIFHNSFRFATHEILEFKIESVYNFLQSYDK